MNGAAVACSSVLDGVVLYANRHSVIVRHADGWMSAYGHLAVVDVVEGQRVAKGDTIGRIVPKGLRLAIEIQPGATR